MPKKGKGKKSGKKKGGKGKKDAAVEEDDGVLTVKKLEEMKDRALLKEVYAQTRELERRENLTKDNEALKMVATHLRTRLDQHLAKQAKVIHLLNEKITVQNDKIMELSTTMANLQEDNELLKEEHEEKQREMTQAHYAQVSQLEVECRALGEINHQLHHFDKTREEFMERLAQYQAALDAENAARVANVEKLERRNVDEKERLKQEMLRKIKETKLSLLAMTEDQLHSTTKRTIRENEHMTTELHYQLREVDRLRRQNTRLAKENGMIRRKINQHSAQQDMLATKTRFFSKLIEKLKLQLEEQARQKEREAVTSRQLAILQRKHAANKQEKLENNDAKIALLEDKVDELTRLTQEARNTQDCVQAELEASRKAAHSMLELQDEAITFLLMAIDDTKARAAEYARTDNSGNKKAPQLGAFMRMSNLPSEVHHAELDFQEAKKVFEMPRHLKEMTLEHRSVFLRMLLHKLNTATPYDEREMRLLGNSNSNSRNGSRTSSRTGSRNGSRLGSRGQSRNSMAGMSGSLSRPGSVGDY